MGRIFVIWQNCSQITRPFTMMLTSSFSTSCVNVMIEDVTWLDIFPRQVMVLFYVLAKLIAISFSSCSINRTVNLHLKNYIYYQLSYSLFPNILAMWCCYVNALSLFILIPLISCLATPNVLLLKLISQCHIAFSGICFS